MYDNSINENLHCHTAPLTSSHIHRNWTQQIRVKNSAVSIRIILNVPKFSCFFGVTSTRIMNMMFVENRWVVFILSLTGAFGSLKMLHTDFRKYTITNGTKNNAKYVEWFWLRRICDLDIFVMMLNRSIFTNNIWCLFAEIQFLFAFNLKQKHSQLTTHFINIFQNF